MIAPSRSVGLATQDAKDAKGRRFSRDTVPASARELSWAQAQLDRHSAGRYEQHPGATPPAAVHLPLARIDYDDIRGPRNEFDW